MVEKLKTKAVSHNLLEAINCRDVKGFRFDNTEYWKKYYEKKDKIHDFFREKRYAKFLRSQLKDGSKMADLASGYGFLPLELQKLDIDITCVDKFPGMIEMTKKHFESNGENLKIKRADIVNLPFEDHSLEAVSAMSTLEHFPLNEVQEDILPEIKRVLKADGLLFVHMPVKSVMTLFKKNWRIYIKHDLPKWACDDDGDVTHKMWLTSEQYFDLIHKAGFKVNFVTFNFIRSNESDGIMKIANKILSLISHNFYPVGKKFSWNLKLLSILATSVAFVSQKEDV
jgi:ubiquinone/menaquinone biosynthesis C-methylase UbiE